MSGSAVTAADALTPAELETLRLASSGRGYKAIAIDAGVSEQTIKNQLASARDKLNVNSTIAAFVAVGWLRAPAAIHGTVGAHLQPSRRGAPCR